jgi:serine/threonine protein kinase
MSAGPGGDHNSPDSLLNIDEICDQFESMLKAGDAPRIEEFLYRADSRHRRKLLRELLMLEADYRRRRGDSPRESEYVHRFPNDQDTVALVFSSTHDLDTTHPLADEGDLPTRSEHSDGPERKLLAENGIGCIVGNYRLTSRLGGGGMGTVYRATHLMIKCERAIKLMNSCLADSPEAIKRFLREAQATVALSHPNIAATYDVNRDGETVYLVMELIEGQDLASLVKQAGPLSLQHAARIIEDVANGLAFAHKAGFVHRDIKPQNIMLSAEDRPVILDMGLVRILDHTEPNTLSKGQTPPTDVENTVDYYRTRLTEDHSLLGTLAYMSPEQARDPQNVDARSDIYSLGCTMYYLLTGKHAFSGSSAEEILTKHLAGSFDRPSESRPALPGSLEQIVLRMIRGKPNDRYASADHVAQALRRWRKQDVLTNVGAQAEPVTFETRDELRDALLNLRLVSEQEWEHAERYSSRQARGWSRTGTPATIRTEATIVPDDDPQDPQSILLGLQALHYRSGGDSGLSGFQVQQITAGNADVLRLPQHRLVERVGRGWKGEVFKAHHIEQNRVDALRTFLPSQIRLFSGTEQEKAIQFIAEAERLARVEDGVFPRVLGFDTYAHRTHGTLFYLSTEYIPGQSAAEFISQHGWTSQAERECWAINVTLSIANGLETAHRQNVLHLDIHDKTVRIDESGAVKLLDLGIARWLLSSPKLPSYLPQDVSSTATISADKAPDTQATKPAASPLPDAPATGTPMVMPPEQWLDRSNISPAIDAYNLGCTLFFLLTGKYPFQADSAMDLMSKHLNDDPLGSRDAKKISRPVNKFLARMLAKHPHERASCQELACGLRELLDGTLTVRKSPLRRPGQWIRSLLGRQAIRDQADLP